MMFPKLIQMAYRRDKLEAEVERLKADLLKWKISNSTLRAEVERLKVELHRAAALMAETGREETARRILERVFGTKDKLAALKAEIK